MLRVAKCGGGKDATKPRRNFAFVPPLFPVLSPRLRFMGTPSYAGLAPQRVKVCGRGTRLRRDRNRSCPAPTARNAYLILGAVIKRAGAAAAAAGGYRSPSRALCFLPNVVVVSLE